MSYNRGFGERLKSLFNYRKWRPPIFPADGERESIPGNAFEMYVAASTNAEQSEPLSPGQKESKESKKRRKELAKAKKVIILSDDEVVVFKDRSPVAPVHLLAIPRVPIRDVLSLRGTKSDAELVRRLQEMGYKALKQLGASVTHRT